MTRTTIDELVAQLAGESTLGEERLPQPPQAPSTAAGRKSAGGLPPVLLAIGLSLAVHVVLVACLVLLQWTSRPPVAATKSAPPLAQITLVHVALERPSGPRRRLPVQVADTAPTIGPDRAGVDAPEPPPAVTPAPGPVDVQPAPAAPDLLVDPDPPAEPPVSAADPSPPSSAPPVETPAPVLAAEPPPESPVSIEATAATGTSGSSAASTPAARDGVVSTNSGGEKGTPGSHGAPALAAQSGVAGTRSGGEKGTSGPPATSASAARRGAVSRGAGVMDVPVPEYPANSRRKAEQGVVLLEVEVLPDGHAGAISVVEDGGLTQLSKAATEAARRGRYRPAMVGGVAVRSVIRLPFRFVLE